ncbi:MAG: hypothetical protein PHS43_00810, partial [Firmicutes bacterium]|nr:hypothetical protein [Bacillota bacterium]
PPGSAGLLSAIDLRETPGPTRTAACENNSLRRTLIYYRKNDNEQNKIVCRERFIQANLNKLLLILVTT